MTSMLLHDRRVEGRSPDGYNFYWIVDERSFLRTALGMVKANGDHRPLDTLHIVCHGAVSDADLGRRMSTGAAHGGWGLQLCDRGLDLRNVGETHIWRGCVRQIVLFACASADTGPGNEGTHADGRRFCGELSLWTGAEVIAPRDPQRYRYGEENFLTRWVFDGPSPIDFGAWEGPVYRFTPDKPDGTRYTPRAYDPEAPGVM